MEGTLYHKIQQGAEAISVVGFLPWLMRISGDLSWFHVNVVKEVE